MVDDGVKRDRGARRLGKAPRRIAVAKSAGLLIAGFLVLQAVFFLLLVAGQAVPDKPIVDNLVKSIDAGTYGPSGLPDRMGGTSDAFTECVYVGTGLGDGSPAESAWQQAGYMPRISSCEKGVADIQALAAGQESAAQGQYYRYWAGYTVITRPALALVGMEGVRIFAGGMLVASLVLVLVTLARKLNWWAATALFLPLVIATNLMSTPSTSFSHAMALSFIFLSTALTAHGAGRSIVRLIGYVSLGAALFSYMDLLTTPAIPWAFSSAVAAAVALARSRTIKTALVAGVVAAVVWPLAFALTWAARWAIAAMFLGTSKVLEHVRGNVEFRTGGEWETVSDRFGAATLRNADYWWDRVPTSHVVVVLVLCAALIAIVIAVRRNGLHGVVVSVMLALPLVIIPIWYEVLRNHSQIHAFFVYRGIPAGFGIGLFAVIVAASVLLTRREAAAAPTKINSETGHTQEGTDHDLRR